VGTATVVVWGLAEVEVVCEVALVVDEVEEELEEVVEDLEVEDEVDVGVTTGSLDFWTIVPELHA
jgi:hypothetical protein